MHHNKTYLSLLAVVTELRTLSGILKTLSWTFDFGTWRLRW